MFCIRCGNYIPGADKELAYLDCMMNGAKFAVMTAHAALRHCPCLDPIRETFREVERFKAYIADANEEA